VRVCVCACACRERVSSRVVEKKKKKIKLYPQPIKTLFRQSNMDKIDSSEGDY